MATVAVPPASAVVTPVAPVPSIFGGKTRLIAKPNPQQTRQPYNQGYMANGAPHQGPVPGAIPLLPNQGRVVQSGPIRLLCIADVRGMI